MPERVSGIDNLVLRVFENFHNILERYSKGYSRILMSKEGNTLPPPTQLERGTIQLNISESGNEVTAYWEKDNRIINKTLNKADLGDLDLKQLSDKGGTEDGTIIALVTSKYGCTQRNYHLQKQVLRYGINIRK